VLIVQHIQVVVQPEVWIRRLAPENWRKSGEMGYPPTPEDSKGKRARGRVLPSSPWARLKLDS
jgi:hypothetical protein